jgi:hypothetical protein
MPYVFLTALDVSKLPVQNLAVSVAAADPPAYQAGLYFNTGDGTLRYSNGSGWITLGAAGGSTPTGPASGDLSGTYPSPQIAAGVIVDADVNASAAIQQSKVQNLVADLAAKLTQATGDARYLQLSGGALTGALTLPADPTVALHAATKQYVDLVSQGLTFKQAVKVATTTNKSLTGLSAIDGITPIAGDRILVTTNTAQAENGIWVAAAGSWTRAPDMDASGELVDGTLVTVSAGAQNGDTVWMCYATGAVPWVPGTTSSSWQEFISLGDLSAGAGLTKTGNTIDVVSANADLTVGADSITVVSAPKWTTARTITLTGDVTSGAVSFDGAANFSVATAAGTGIPKFYAGDVAAGTSPVVTHNLNTRDVQVQVYRNSTPWDEVGCGVERTSVNAVTLQFGTAVSAAAYRAVVVGR